MKNIKNKKEKITASSPEEMVCVESSDKEEVVCAKGGEVVSVEAKESEKPQTKNGGVWIGTINFFAAPYQELKENYEKKYGQAKKLFVIDLILLGIIGLLFGFNIYLFLTKTTGGLSWFNFPEITAPGDVVSEPVAGSLLKTEMKINGEAQIVLNPGEDLEYVVSYYNGGSKELYDVAVKVDLAGAAVDLSQFSLSQGTLRGGAVVWTKDQIPDFVKLLPGKSGELKFKVSTSQIVEPARVLNFGSLLKSELEISYKLESSFGEAHNFKSAIREDKFNSDLVLGDYARYYTPEGDQLGLGPLPPKVGERTTYWVFWNINNNLNDLINVSVSALLPPNVSWTGRMSVTLGQLNYNSARRQINWKVGEVGCYTGEEWPKLGVAFELALVPTAEQLGSEPALLGQVKVFGEDKFTGQFLEREGTVLTTNLIYDSLAEGKGRVAK